MGLSQAYLTSRSSRDAARTAASAEERAAQMATDETRRQFDLTRSDMAPWLETGRGALNELSRLMGLGGPGGGASPAGGSGNTYEVLPDGSVRTIAGPGGGGPDYSGFLASPDYRFALDQGLQATERSASATGNLRSGNTLAALTQYGQGMATQRLNDYRNTLIQLAGGGQNAGNTLGTLGANAATNIGGYYQSAGNARASGVLNANAASQRAYGQAGQNTLAVGSMLGWFGGYGRG